MPGQRAEGQKLIPIPMDANFVADIDRAYRRLNYSHRAEFIRAAVREKLERMGYPVSPQQALAPPRTGRSSQARTRYRITPQRPAPNERKATHLSDEQRLLQKAAASVDRAGTK